MSRTRTWAALQLVGVLSACSAATPCTAGADTALATLSVHVLTGAGKIVSDDAGLAPDGSYSHLSCHFGPDTEAYGNECTLRFHLGSSVTLRAVGLQPADRAEGGPAGKSP